MTKNHQAIFLSIPKIPLFPSLLSVPKIPPFLLYSLRSSLLGHFLITIIMGRLASHFFPQIPTFLVITGQLSTFLFFAPLVWRACALSSVGPAVLSSFNINRLLRFIFYEIGFFLPLHTQLFLEIFNSSVDLKTKIVCKVSCNHIDDP